MSVSSDTHADARAIQLKRQRGMSPEDRMKLAIEMSEATRLLAIAGLRYREPHLKPDEILLRLVQQLYNIRVPP